MKLMKFEGVKWLRQLKNKLLVIALLLASLGFIFISNQQNEEQRQTHLEELSVLYNRYYDNMMSLQMVNEEVTEEVAATISLYNQGMQAIDEEYLGINQDDWQRAISGYLAWQSNQLELLAAGENVGSEVDQAEVEMNLQVNQYFLDQKIEPLRYQKKISGLNTLQLFYQGAIGIVLVLVLVLLFFDLFTNEFENQSIKFLYTQPFKRSAFIKSKIQFAFFLVLGLSIALTIVIVSGGSLYSQDFGILRYPIVISEDFVLELWQYLLLLFGTAVLWSVLVILLIAWLSLVTKRGLLTIVLSIFLLTAPYAFIEMLDDGGSLWRWFPHYYLQMPTIIQEAAIADNLGAVLLQGGILLLLTMLILGILLSYQIKKERTVNHMAIKIN